MLRSLKLLNKLIFICWFRFYVVVYSFLVTPLREQLGDCYYSILYEV